MHAATNTHVARYYHAPSKRKGRVEWEPNLDYFQRQFNGHPERLKVRACNTCAAAVLRNTGARVVGSGLAIRLSAVALFSAV